MESVEVGPASGFWSDGCRNVSVSLCLNEFSIIEFPVEIV